MKQFVVMSKATAMLCIGYRVCFMDGLNVADVKLDATRGYYAIALLSGDGWILEHPAYGFPVFINNEYFEKYCEILGEL